MQNNHPCPAISLCASPGWRDNKTTLQPPTIFKTMCGQNESKGPWECIKEKAFSFNELVFSAARGAIPRVQTNISDVHWNWHVPSAMVGRCYILDYNVPLGIDMMTDTLSIGLDPEKTYYVALYNPDFFTFTGNSLAMPTSAFVVTPSELEKQALMISLEASKFRRLNRPNAPCNPDVTYNFTSCVIESVARNSSCTMPWNGRISGR